MRRIGLVHAACLIALVLAPVAHAFDYINGRVTSVSDGDTVRVLSDGQVHKIRFYGIDAPESDQKFGPEAKKFTADRIKGKYVTVRVKEKDQYGRIVGEIFHNGESLNRLLVKNGLAWWYERYSKNDHDLRDLEKGARTARAGLWEQDDPIAPWDWRQGVRPAEGPEVTEEDPAPDAPAPSIFADKSGEALHAAIRGAYKPTKNLGYDNARLKLFTIVDKNDGKVILVYTGHELPVPDTRPTHAANGERISTEHTWPKSKFKEASAKNWIHDDIHHLFPVYQDPNNDRSNDPFAEIPDDETERWWGSGDSVDTPPPAAERDRFSEDDGVSFEAREAHKGNVARAMMYVYIIYGNDRIDKDWFRPQIATLLTWHREDPVDDRERDRNTRVKDVQGNENPFVIDSTLFERVLED